MKKMASGNIACMVQDGVKPHHPTHSYLSLHYGIMLPSTSNFVLRLSNSWPVVLFGWSGHETLLSYITSRLTLICICHPCEL